MSEVQDSKPFDPRKFIAEVKAGDAEREAKRNARKEIVVEFLKDSELKSPRFQAFADYTDVHRAGGMREIKNTTQALILETIRQRRNGVRGYDKEFRLVEELESEYEREMRKEMEGLEFPNMSVAEATRLRTIAEFLAVKNQEIDRRNQQPQTPPQK